ncbi:MAG: hypothetical protein ACLRY5_05510 [Zhenhengia sp.]
MAIYLVQRIHQIEANPYALMYRNAIFAKALPLRLMQSGISQLA